MVTYREGRDSNHRDITGFTFIVLNTWTPHKALVVEVRDTWKEKGQEWFEHPVCTFPVLKNYFIRNNRILDFLPKSINYWKNTKILDHVCVCVCVYVCEDMCPISSWKLKKSVYFGFSTNFLRLITKAITKPSRNSPLVSLPETEGRRVWKWFI